MKCVNHKESNAVATCSLCGVGLCDVCDIKLAGRFYCQKCTDELVKDGAIVALRKLYEILEEKRKYHRVHVLLSIEIMPIGREKFFLKGIMYNMSMGGMAVICDVQISINEIVYLSFVLPTGDIIENIQAGVVRSEKIGEKFNLGLIFMNTIDKQQIIDDFVLNTKKKKYTEDSANISKYLF